MVFGFDLEIFLNSFISLLSDFLDPQKRIFVGYLLSASLLVILVLRLKYPDRFSLQLLMSTLFSKKVWLSPSSFADIKLLLFNRLLFGGAITQVLSKSTVSLGVYFLLMDTGWFSLTPKVLLPANVCALLFTVTLFVVDDYSRYWTHRALHRIPILWEFHKVHHSATTLTPLTVFRTHPVEVVVFSIRGALVQGTVVGIAFAIFGSNLNLLTILGANFLSVLFHALGSNLRHSHIPLRYPSWLERWLVSPAQHQLHHSVSEEHFDKNFGVAFACWDLIHGTHHFSQARCLTYGLSGQLNCDRRKQTLSNLLFAPVTAAYCHLIHLARSALFRAVKKDGRFRSETRPSLSNQIIRFRSFHARKYFTSQLFFSGDARKKTNAGFLK